MDQQEHPITSNQKYTPTKHTNQLAPKHNIHQGSQYLAMSAKITSTTNKLIISNDKPVYPITEISQVHIKNYYNKYAKTRSTGQNIHFAVQYMHNDKQ